MRHRAIALAALLLLPGTTLVAQVGRAPRPTIIRRPPGTTPEPLPPTSPEIARALQIQRSRWSGEGYGIVNMMQLPAVNGGVMNSNSFGGGTRLDYRYASHFSATIDLTAAYTGGPAVAATAEVGTRYWPLARESTVRPFLDLRGGYMSLYDETALATGAGVGPGTIPQNFAAMQRYSHGVGGVMGGGAEYSLSHSFAVTTGISAMRNHMTTYRSIGTGAPPAGDRYWMTALRYTLGIKFNPSRTLFDSSRDKKSLK